MTSAPFFFLSIVLSLFIGCYTTIAQVAVVIDGMEVAPFSIAIDKGSVINPPENSVHLVGLDTMVYLVNIYQNQKLVYTRKLHMPEPGTYWFVFQTDRKGHFQLRYRGKEGLLPNAPPYLYIPLPDVVTEQVFVDEVNIAPQNVIDTASQRMVTPPIKPSLLGLENKLQQTEIEFEKVQLLEQFIAENAFVTQDIIRLASFLKFEHSKLQFFLAALSVASLECQLLENELVFPHTLETLRAACNRRTE